MSGETEAQISGWTVDTLHSHLVRMLEERDKRFEQRFIAQQEAIQAALLAQKDAVAAALTAADRALTKAESASEKRFEGVNEFRSTLADQAALLMPRGEVSTLISALDGKVSDLADRVTRAEGRNAGVALSWAIGTAGIGLLIGVIGIVMALNR